jgi:hypothetical protein
MTFDLSDTLLLQHLEGVAAQLQVEVRYENLADDEVAIQSGGCKVLGRRLILIDHRRSPAAQAKILARELGRFDLEPLYLLPQIRDFILGQSDPRKKNLPHK